MNKKKMQAHWVILPSSTFYDRVDEACAILYNTDNGLFMVSTNKSFIRLIDRLREPKNMGSVAFDDKEIADFSSDFSEALNICVLKTVRTEDNTKPLILLPILNLQRDLDKGKNIDDRLFIMEKKLRFLTGVNIWMSSSTYDNSDKKKVAYRNSYYKDVCTPVYDNLPLKDMVESGLLIKILDELRLSGVARVNLIIGSSFLAQTSPDKFAHILNKYPFSFTISCFYEDYAAIESHLKGVVINNLDYRVYLDKYNLYDGNVVFKELYSDKASFLYLVSDESEIENQGIENLELIPIWVTDNIDFFERNVMLTIEDLQNTVLSHQKIFRNMKLNANFFGVLDIDYSGKISPHGSESVLGNLKDGCTLLQAVCKELKENHTWRLTRNLTSCCSCPFKYICPPISVYELKGNLTSVCKIRKSLENGKK